MSREIAKSYYNRRPGDPARGSYVSSKDARDAIDTIYDDLESLRSDVGVFPIQWKGGNVSAWNYGAWANIPLILQDIASSGLNSVTIPVRVLAANVSDSSPVVDEAHLQYAQAVAAALPPGIQIIAEPYPWVDNGNQSETLWVPTNPSMWHTKWREACVRVAQAFPQAQACYIGSNIVSMEAGFETEWATTVSAVRAVTAADIMYRCNWWYESTRLESLKNWNLLSLIDVIAVAAYFELTDTVSPALDEVTTSLQGSLIFNRDQRIAAQVEDLALTHNKPMFFGELNCAGSQSALAQPWNPDTSVVADRMVQARLFRAYTETFSRYPWWKGFSVFNIGGFQDSGYVLSIPAKSYLRSIPTL